MNRRALAIAATLAAAGSCHAQLIVGFDDTASGATTCWEIRVSDGSYAATPLFSGIDVWSLASDNVNNRLYVGSGTDLFVYDGSGAPTLLGTTNIGGSATSFVGYAFSNGRLYATRNIANEGVYEINLTTFEASLVVDYADADYDFGGFDYDETTGAFYGSNDDTSPHGAGLFEIDLAGSITKIANYPPFTGSGASPDVDGLAAGAGIAYLVPDEPGEIGRYDIINGVALSPIPNPFGSSEIFSAGAYAPWIPAPGSLGLLGMTALVARRRR